MRAPLRLAAWAFVALALLRQEATTALDQLMHEHQRPEYADSHAYWVHALDLIQALAKTKAPEGAAARARQAAAEKTLRQTGVKILVGPDGLVRVSPEPPSYEDRAKALKAAAAASIYSRLAGQTP
jgi:hypothetical protein